MSRRPRPQACAVCGMTGYWVGFDPDAGEDRCLNHLEGTFASQRGAPQPADRHE